jgi:glycosyltransferase involved in cell wall biosynthesis
MSKKKILLLGDDIRIVSGVSLICKNLILNGVSKFDWVQLAAQANNPDNGQIIDVSESVDEITKTQGSYVRLYCTTGYGNQTTLRNIITQENIDCILHITDPRRWTWLYRMENEIRQHIPICYYHVWDNYPLPHYNKGVYGSCDLVACISKITYNCVTQVTPDANSHYIPHGVKTEIFTPIDTKTSDACKKNILPDGCDFLVFCNNVNIPRKQLPLLIESFAWFCKEIGEANAKRVALMLHTNPTNKSGSNLLKIVDDLHADLNIIFSSSVVDDSTLNQMYNTADVTINIASNEGFGLSTTESLSAGTPIIVSNTGGLSEQVDDTQAWGLKVEPKLRNLIGSTNSPYIYEDICDQVDIGQAILSMYNKDNSERTEMGKLGRTFVEKNYNQDTMCKDLYTEMEYSINNFIPQKKISITKVT